MHEEGLLRDLRRKIEEISDRERALRISSVRLWVGALSHVTEATLRRRWETTVAGTAAEGARLEVETSADLADPRAAGVVLLGVDVPAEAPEIVAGGSAGREFLGAPARPAHGPGGS
ncbi:MAG: hydrogenase/urease maturation nickel metallochaperone HypA [Thermoplasmata archaeon]